MEGEDAQRNSTLHSSAWLGRQMVHVKTTAVIAEQRHPLCVCARACVRERTLREVQKCASFE